jgi:hypothetical protein
MDRKLFWSGLYEASPITISGRHKLNGIIGNHADRRGSLAVPRVKPTHLRSLGKGVDPDSDCLGFRNINYRQISFPFERRQYTFLQIPGPADSRSFVERGEAIELDRVEKLCQIVHLLGGGHI